MFGSSLLTMAPMLLHAIGRSEGPSSTNPWIAKYIFPGGYAPALSEILQAIERSGLIVKDIEVLREHYALTLQEWRKRFSGESRKGRSRTSSLTSAILGAIGRARFRRPTFGNFATISPRAVVNKNMENAFNWAEMPTTGARP
jgi:hypothetical protein